MTDQATAHQSRRARQESGSSRTGCLLRTAAPASQAVLTIAAIAGLPDCVARRACCAAALHADPVDLMRCRIVARLVTELFAAIGPQDLPGNVVRRQPHCHRRQVAMYLAHVVLSVPYRSIAIAFGRDRTTVMHACFVTEDRRDDAGYDRFVERCERCIEAVFAPFGQDHAGL